MIIFQDMLKQIDRGDIFGLTFVTLDIQRKKGGKIYTYKEAILSTKLKKLRTRQPTAVEAQRAILDGKRDPNNYEHFTRNIIILQEGHATDIIHKIRPQLITHFNGQKVLL